MLTRLLWRMERAPSWLEYVFVRETGSKEEAVEADPLDVGCSIVATDMSVVCCLERLDRSLALDMRVGTSDRDVEFIYAYAAAAAFGQSYDAALVQGRGAVDICLSDSASLREIGDLGDSPQRPALAIEGGFEAAQRDLDSSDQRPGKGWTRGWALVYKALGRWDRYRS